MTFYTSVIFQILSWAYFFGLNYLHLRNNWFYIELYAEALSCIIDY